MVSRASGGILRTEPTETYRNGDGGALPAVATDVMDEASSAAWNAWIETHKNLLRDDLCDTIAQSLYEYCRPFEQQVEAQARQIKELELRLASAIGAIDVLRGRGTPNAPRVRGTFNPEQSYAELDIVAFGGSSWIATRDNPGDLPSDNGGWQLLASKGARGERGARGAQGPRGGDGATLSWFSFDPERMVLTSRLTNGTAGPELRLDLIFAGLDIDVASYAVVLKMLDGSELRLDLRPLFERFFHEVTGR
jgi:hypothetical protein